MNNCFIFSDLHGQGKLWEKIKQFMASHPDADFLYLGDACDRGEDGYKIIKEMLANDSIIYLKGNHEDMFVKAAKVLYKQGARAGDARDIVYDAYHDEDVNLHLNNGGFSTLMTWVEDGMPMGIINELATLPTLCTVINHEGVKLTLSHAGFRKEKINDKEEHFWSRDHFNREWEDGIMIHGHTPVMSSSFSFFTDINERELYKNPKPVWYANGTKLDIDTGCFKTGVIYLVDIDTMEMKKFCSE